jgi:hypothetical protein
MGFNSDSSTHILMTPSYHFGFCPNKAKLQQWVYLVYRRTKHAYWVCYDLNKKCLPQVHLLGILLSCLLVGFWEVLGS